MPGGSKKSKEETWTENELVKAIQGDGKEKKHRSRDKESRESSHSKDKETRSSDRSKESKDKREQKHRSKTDDEKHRVESKSENDKDHKERRRHKENGEGDEDNGKHRKDRHEDKERGHRDRGKDEDREKRHRDRGKDEDREKRHRDREKDEDREKRHRDREKDEDREKRHRDREKDEDREKRHRDRGKDEDREKRHRDREKDLDKEKKHRDREKANKGDDKTDGKHRDRRDKDREHKRDGDDDEPMLRVKNGKDDTGRKHKDESSKERDGSGKERHRSGESRSKEGSSSKEKKDRQSSGKERKQRESGAKNDKDRERRKREKQREKARQLEIQRLAEQEEERKRKEDEDAYDYDDDFDDYDDDDFEEEENDSRSEDTSVGEQSKNTKEEKKQQHSKDKTQQNEIREKIEKQEAMKMTESEEEGLSEVMKAITAENEKVTFITRQPKDKSKKSKTRNKEATVEETSPKKVHGKINFVAANQKQITDKVAKKTKKRGEELLKLIQLDVRSIDLFDMPPMTEYELYMKRFGSSDSKQMFTQTNDEYYDKEIQTDEIETDSRWCQHSSDLKSAGSEKSTSMSTQTEVSMDSILSADSTRLNKFLLSASKVCLSLLEEIEAGIEQPRKRYVETRSTFSDGYVTLGSSQFLVLGRDVCDMSYSPTQTNMLLTAHGTSNVVKKDLKSSKGLLCVWNANEPTKPTKLLICESVPKSCCFGSGLATYAFAGMEDGVVAMWDLNEPSYFHETCEIGDTMLIFQTVTFTTAALPEKHNFPIVAITPLTSTTGGGSHDSMDLSFQLATMDQSASVHIWILVQTQGIHSYDMNSVSEDLGLSPNGRVKLVQSAIIDPPGQSVSSFTHLFTMTCLSVEQGDPNHMYAGTQQGEILHLTRFGNRPTPKIYRSGGGSCKVNAIDVCPWKMPYMLACYDDGCVRLFYLKIEDALMTWPNTTNGVALIDVKWSRSKPSVFYTIDSESVLYAWNLLESDIAPTFQLKIQRKDKRAVGFTLPNDYSALGRGSTGRDAELALIFGDGSVEIHRLNKKLAELSPSELDEMESFLSEIT